MSIFLDICLVANISVALACGWVVVKTAQILHRDKRGLCKRCLEERERFK